MPIRLYQSRRFPLEESIQILSVFLSDHDARTQGQIRYRVYNEPSAPEVKVASTFLRNKGFSEYFEGSWMIVAEWRDVPQFGTDFSAVSL